MCLFTGAVEILRNIDTIDFSVLMSGKICFDEIQRCKRLARKDSVKMPAFMRNEKMYKKKLTNITTLNGLNLEHPKKNPPVAYMQRIKRGRRVSPGDGKVRKARGRRARGTGIIDSDAGSSIGSSCASLVSIKSNIEKTMDTVNPGANVLRSSQSASVHVVRSYTFDVNEDPKKGEKSKVTPGIPFKYCNVTSSELTSQMKEMSVEDSHKINSVSHKPSSANQHQQPNNENKIENYNNNQIRPKTFCVFERSGSDLESLCSTSSTSSSLSEHDDINYTAIELMKSFVEKESLSTLSSLSAEKWKSVASSVIDQKVSKSNNNQRTSSPKPNSKGASQTVIDSPDKGQGQDSNSGICLSNSEEKVINKNNVAIVCNKKGREEAEENNNNNVFLQSEIRKSKGKTLKGNKVSALEPPSQIVLNSNHCKQEVPKNISNKSSKQSSVNGKTNLTTIKNTQINTGDAAKLGRSRLPPLTLRQVNQDVIPEVVNSETDIEHLHSRSTSAHSAREVNLPSLEFSKFII